MSSPGPLDAGHRPARAPAPVWLAVSATLLGLCLGYLLKNQCAANAWVDNFQYRRLCYNDLQPLYGIRGIADGLTPYRDVQLEYPVITGMFIDLTGKLLRFLVDAGVVSSAGDGAFFQLSALLLAPFAVAVTLMMRPHTTAGRLMLWAVGTPMILYAFHNWDLLVVAPAVWSLVAWRKNKMEQAGAAAAIGSSAKLFPAFFMAPFALGKLAEGDRKGLARLILWFSVAYLAINIPWIVVSSGPAGGAGAGTGIPLREPGTNGWLGVWFFHADRYPDFGTVWYWIAHHGRVLFPWPGWNPGQTAYRDFVSVLSFVLFAGAAAWSLWSGYKRRHAPGGFPAATISMAILVFFLLFSKVHSPQYALWLAPFLVLLKVPPKHIAAYLAADLAVYVSGFYYFTVQNEPAPGWKGAFELSVLARAAALGALAWWALRRDADLWADEPAPRRADDKELFATFQNSSRTGSDLS